MMIGSCAALATLIGTFDAAGRSISGSFAHAEPVFGAKATKDGVSIDGHVTDGESATHGAWREERERRRQNFFKVRLKWEQNALVMELFLAHNDLTHSLIRQS
jgi:hypothetical protein